MEITGFRCLEQAPVLPDGLKQEASAVAVVTVKPDNSPSVHAEADVAPSLLPVNHCP